MSSIGYVLSELTPGGQVINEYACANRAVARGLATAIIPADFLEHSKSANPQYTIKEHEFTDSEYPSTIGYLAVLPYQERNRHLYIQYGELIA